MTFGGGALRSYSQFPLPSAFRAEAPRFKHQPFPMSKPFPVCFLNLRRNLTRFRYLILLCFVSSAVAQNNGDNLSWNGPSNTSSWTTQTAVWYDASTSSPLSLYNIGPRNKNYNFFFVGNGTNSAVAPPTMTISSANIYATGVTFQNNFNAANTTTISNGGSSPSLLVLGSSSGSAASTAAPWIISDNASSGTVSFVPTSGTNNSSLGLALFTSGTFNVAAGATIAVSASIADYDATHTGGITKTGAGTLVVSATQNTYTGGTNIQSGTLNVQGSGLLNVNGAITVNSGGTLLLSGAGNHIADNLTLNLAGGTYNTGGLSETTGALTLTSTSFLDLGNGASVANLGAFVSSSTGLLQVLHWSGNPNGGGIDQVLFYDSVNALNAMSHIEFLNPDGYVPGLYQGIGVGNEIVPGALVPIPEPGTWAAAAATIGGAAWTQRTRLAALRRRTLSKRSRPVRPTA
jgi:autotransporter-associated beta strand protein